MQKHPPYERWVFGISMRLNALAIFKFNFTFGMECEFGVIEAYCRDVFKGNLFEVTGI